MRPSHGLQRWTVLCFGLAAVVWAVSCQPTAKSPTDEKVAAADYEVHEWGLVRLGQLSEVATSAAPLPDPVRLDGGSIDLAVPKKPVLYFHRGPEFEDATRIDVELELAHGTLQEVWPTPNAGPQPSHGKSFAWRGLELLSTPCGAEVVPAASSPACASLPAGALCEAAELARYVTPSPTCLRTGGVDTPVLLYNGILKGPQPPLLFAPGPSGVALTNPGSHPVGPLWALSDGRLYAFDLMVPSDSVRLIPGGGEPYAEALPKLRKDVAASLVSVGLTAAEADQFVAAWETDVLGDAPTWRVFGLYAQKTVDEMFPLTLTPPPKEVVRALFFTIEGATK